MFSFIVDRFVIVLIHWIKRLITTEFTFVISFSYQFESVTNFERNTINYFVTETHVNGYQKHPSKNLNAMFQNR